MAAGLSFSRCAGKRDTNKDIGPKGIFEMASNYSVGYSLLKIKPGNLYDSPLDAKIGGGKNCSGHYGNLNFRVGDA
jgi:hypothetical protein